MRCSAAFGFYGLGQTGLRVLGSEHLGIGLAMFFSYLDYSNMMVVLPAS